MPSFIPQRYEQILPRMVARVVARSVLSDLVDSSVLKHILAAVARELDQLNYQMSLIPLAFSIDTAQGADLDARAREISPNVTPRQQASAAVGTVVFSRNVVAGTVTLPVGTQVRSALGQVFTTTGVATLTPTGAVQVTGHVAGQDSLPTPIVAAQPGSAGNVATGTITAFAQKPTGVDTVLNLAPTLQGTDQESDAAFRQRLTKFISSLPRATLSALEAGVLGKTDPVSGATILFSRGVEDPINAGRVSLYVDDGTGAASSTTQVTGEVVTQGFAGPTPNTAVGGEAGFYLKQVPIKAATLTLTSSLTGAWTAGTQYTINTANGYICLLAAGGATRGDQITASYFAYTGLVALAQKVVDGVASDRADYPGLRAIGTQVLCLPPQTIAVAVQAGLTIARGFDPVATAAAAQAAVLGYINGQTIGVNVQVASIIQAIMSTPGVLNTAVVSPASDIYVLPYQLARVTAANIQIA